MKKQDRIIANGVILQQHEMSNRGVLNATMV